MVNCVSASNENTTQEKYTIQKNNEITNNTETTPLIKKDINEDTKKAMDTNNSKKDTKLTINKIDTAKYDDNITITGKFTNADNKALIKSNVQFNINGKTTTLKTDNTGTYTTTIKANQVGKNNITVTYKGNEKYNPTNITTTFTVIKKDTKLTLQTIKTAKYDDNITITGKFTNADNKALTNSNIQITINEKTRTLKTDNTGTYTTTIKANQVGKNNITVTYKGNEKYNPTNITTTITVNKKDTKLTINSQKTVGLNDNTTITGKFTNADNKALTNSNIQITINGKTRTLKTDNSGIYTYTYKAVKLGTNNITVSYKGNNNYNAYSTSTTFKVIQKEDPDVRLSSSEIHPGVSKTFLAILPYDSTGTVVLKIDKTVIANNLEVEDGLVIYTYKIPETYNSEEYTLFLEYSGDTQYNAKTVNATLTLTPEGGRVSANMSMKNVTAKFASTKTLTVNLNKNAFGTVVFQIDGKNITDPVKFENGTVKYNYKVNVSSGVHNLTAIYNGNYMYEKTNVSSNITVTRLNSEITLNDLSSKAGKITLFTATVKDELGNPIKNNKVVFKLNGVTIDSNKTDEKGIVKLYYQLDPTLYKQTYTITAKSTETSTVYNTQKNATLTLEQLETKVMVPSISTIPSKTTIITATVVDEFNNYVTKGKVTFAKGNEKLGTVAVANGFAKFTYESNYETTETAKIYAAYYGDWKYASSKGSGTYKVTMLKTSTIASAVDAKPNSLITLTATVRDENQNLASDGNVTFILNNKVLGTSSVTNGIARYKYSLDSFAAGEYRIKCDYFGSKIYKNSTNTNIMTVTRYGVTIKGSSVNAIVGNTSSITLTVTDEEKYNVKNGTIKYYVNNNYVGSAKVSNGISTLEYLVPSEYDGKTVKYYATYEKNDIYESSSYSNTLTVSHQKIVYVSPSGSDSNLGDKTHPFKTLEYAVNHITLFGTIYLSSGTFSASGISINNSITIIGTGKDKSIIDGGNKGVPIFNISKRNVALTLDGVTIKNGKSNSEFSAGAIFSSGKLNINNSKFINNTASGNYSGGAIYSNGILTVENTEFVNNIATSINSQGGAIRSYDNETYITNCVFDSNKVTGSNSTGGSAIYSDSGDIIINRTTFTKNSVSGTYITGGVIRSVYGAMVIADSTFNNNIVKSTYFATGGIIGSLGSGVAIINSTINSNTLEATDSGGGSAIYIETAALDIKDSKINSNKITTNKAYGGVIYSYNAYVTLTGSTLNANSINAKELGFGGALYSVYGKVKIIKSKITNNTVKAKDIALAGAIYSASNVTISNSDLCNNYVNASSLGGGAIANMGNLTVTQTNFIDNNANNAGNAITSTTTATNNINNNYWGSTSPNWNNLLHSVSQPNSYSKTKFNN